MQPSLTDLQQKELDRLIGLRTAGKITDKQTVKLASLIDKRDAVPTLTKTAITQLQKIHREVLYSRTDEITSKYLEKGIAVEEQSKDLDAVLRMKFIEDHPERLNNEFLTGQADAIYQDVVIDYKSSWSAQTFPVYDEDDKLPNIAYYWQLQGYMWLYGKKKSELVYCLIDTPFDLINDSIRRLQWKHGISIDLDYIPEEHKPLIVETVTNMIYTHDGLEDFCAQSTCLSYEDFDGKFKAVPDPLRHRVFKLDRDEEAIEAIKTHVEMARKQLNQYTLLIADRLNN